MEGINRMNNESYCARKSSWCAFVKLCPQKKKIFFLEINYFSGINWIITGLVPHLHKALLVHWIQEAAVFKHLNVTGTEPFNIFFFLSQGFALGNSTNAVRSCQWRNSRSLWYGCKSNYRFVNDEVYISRFKFQISCSQRLFYAVIKRGSRLLDLQ